MQGKFEDLTGRTFYRLTVIRRGTNKNDRLRWLCTCICGNTVNVQSSMLKGGRTRSCGCLLKEWIRETKRLRPFESLYNWLLFRCKRKGSKTKCLLSYEEFIQFTKKERCAYCNTLLVWAEYNISYNCCACNLDRKDNKGHYTVRNCIVCCPMCNSLKSTFSQEEFIEKVKQIANNLEGQRWKTL